MRDYQAAVTCMDESIGRLLSAIDERGWREDTLVIFFSDNGGSGLADNSPLRGKKGTMWEGGLRVPCLLHWPGRLPAGEVNDAFLSSLEMVPTVAVAAEIDLPEDIVFDGFDMLPVLRKEVRSSRAEMFWERRNERAARMAQWKWVEMPGRGGGLFDLSVDAGEEVDLSEERPEILAKLKERFTLWKKTMEAAEPRGPFRDH